MGHRTVEQVVDLLADPAHSAITRADVGEMASRLPFGAPEAPQDFDALLDRLERDVFAFMGRTAHPGYFAFVPSCGTFLSALAEFMASALNVYVGSWMEGAGPSRLELVVLDWFKRWIGYPPDASGSLVSGGSVANITALACARESLLGPMNDRAVAYMSDQAHSSIARAVRLLGFGPDQLRVLPTDRWYRLPAATLEAAIDADARAGRQPLLVAAGAGATNTGAVDPLPELAEVCRERGVWLHADAAYGGFAVLTERGRAQLDGIDLTDSVTLDPHKWLYQPYECGSLLIRHGDLLRRAFEVVPDYLSDARAGADEVNFADLGLQQSRGFRALKVWLSVSYFGVDAFREAIDRSLDLAELAQEQILAAPELEFTAPPSLGVLCFRRRGRDGASEEEVAQLNVALVRGLEATGRGLVSSTRLRGRYTVRMCCLNHTSNAEDVERVIDHFAQAPAGVLPGASAAKLAHRTITATELRRVPLFECLGRDDLDRVVSRAREQHVARGDVAGRRWDAARDFHVLLDGRAVVERDGEQIAELGPGDFFGELAALDWDAGYAYARAITVRATARLRLLVLSPAALEEIMRLDAGLSDRVERGARRHLAAMR